MSGRKRLVAVSIVAATWVAACSSRSSGPDDGGTIPAPDPTVGLLARPSNLTCIAPDRTGGGGTALEPTRVFPALAFVQPLAMLQVPGDDSRWFVLEKTGRVRVFANDPAVNSFDTDFIDLDAVFNVNDNQEGGLLGMAFAPDFETSREVYLSWTDGSPMVSRIDRFTSLDGGATLDPGSRTNVLSVNQDFENHNGGQIAFGSDGYLYASFGDGGSGGDPNNRAQDTTNLLGAMLRIDIDGGSPYGIPTNNPFAGNPVCPANHSSPTNCPEIYAWGLRNPWRWSFDSATGDLLLGDVGQGSFEEIDRIELGGNYGWDCREAFQAFSNPAPSCATASGLIDPVHAYGRSQGVSVTGGYVYRGTTITALVGSYVFGDFGSGRIWRLVGDGRGGFTAEELLDTSLSIASFAEDDAGELYVVDIAGALYRLDPVVSGGGGGSPVATMLSATGCFDPAAPSEPASGLIPYTVAAPFWSDGLDKERWLALPNGTTIAVDADDDFVFPTGTVLAKHFRLHDQLIETRLYMRHPDGGWAGYSYAWNAAQSDAILVSGAQVVDIGGQEWLFPDASQCDGCHTSAAGFSLGLELGQLNRDFTYQATGRTANQLHTLNAIGLFDLPLGDVVSLPQIPDPFGADAPSADRARAYLHTNCAQCHRPGGPTSVGIDLRSTTPLDAMGACGISPQRGDLGIAGAMIIAPGSPDESVLLERLGRRGDAAAMPPLASALPDTEGQALIRDWIEGLAGC